MFPMLGPTPPLRPCSSCFPCSGLLSFYAGSALLTGRPERDQATGFRTQDSGSGYLNVDGAMVELGCLLVPAEGGVEWET